MKLTEAKRQFIKNWRAMGMQWGINLFMGPNTYPTIGECYATHPGFYYETTQHKPWQCKFELQANY